MMKDVYVESYGEGKVAFEGFLGNFVGRKNPYGLFGGLGVFPDIAVKIPTANRNKLLFMELDNGRNASDLKCALGKALFDSVTLDCDYCIEFFHNRGKNPLDKFLKNERESQILRKLETHFNTMPYVF